MLRFLKVRHLAVIEQVEVEFGPGFNVLTGETGAGKSILVEGIGLLVGGRASSDLIRTGEDAASVQAVFDGPGGEELIIRREITSAGRSRAFVNDDVVTTAALKELGRKLVGLQGQHEHQQLLDPASHLALIDAFGALGTAREEVAARFQAWRDAQDALDRTKMDARERAARLELLSFQLDEIEKTGPKAGEDEALMAERQVLANAERLTRLSAEAYAALYDGDGAALAWLCENGPYRHAGGRLQMRAVKLYIDGALGSRGAALLEDYSDDPGNRGLLLLQPAQLLEVAGRARGCGVQVATHAIGDRGNRVVLDAYQALLAGQDPEALRWRIEHAQVLAPEDLPRLAALGAIASMQPTHATSDMPWAQDRVGPLRIVGAYAWRQLRDSGARLALGSDFPVESVDPRLGLHAAATRADREGHPAGGWLPQEKLTAWEALRGFTRDAAWAGFAEDEVGTLAPGMRADFVLLDRDPLAVPPADLPALQVLATWVDGRPVYQRPEAP